MILQSALSIRVPRPQLLWFSPKLGNVPMVMLMGATMFLFTIAPILAQEEPAPESSPTSEIDRPSVDHNQLHNQGIEQFHKGEHREALDSLEQALQIRRQQGDRLAVAETLNAIGEVYSNFNESDRALPAISEALEIYRQQNPQGASETALVESGKARSLNLLGFLHRQQGEFPQALEHHQEALRLAQSAGDRSEVGESLHNIAAVYASQAQPTQALSLIHISEPTRPY